MLNVCMSIARASPKAPASLIYLLSIPTFLFALKGFLRQWQRWICHVTKWQILPVQGLWVSTVWGRQKLVISGNTDGGVVSSVEIAFTPKVRNTTASIEPEAALALLHSPGLRERDSSREGLRFFCCDFWHKQLTEFLGCISDKSEVFLNQVAQKMFLNFCM